MSQTSYASDVCMHSCAIKFSLFHSKNQSTAVIFAVNLKFIYDFLLCVVFEVNQMCEPKSCLPCLELAPSSAWAQPLFLGHVSSMHALLVRFPCSSHKSEIVSINYAPEYVTTVFQFIWFTSGRLNLNGLQTVQHQYCCHISGWWYYTHYWSCCVVH